MNNIADDLARAFNDGYEKGKSDAEAHIFHCGDTDEPQTNADRIRSMSDEEFSHFLFGIQCAPASKPKEWLDWLKQEAE